VIGNMLSGLKLGRAIQSDQDSPRKLVLHRNIRRTQVSQSIKGEILEKVFS
jgi:hypothetical protein